MIWFILLVAMLPALGWAAGASDQSIQVKDNQNSYILSVPVSRLVMSVPKGGLIQANPNVGGSTEGPRYFYFEDSGQGLVLSGWFEPQSAFQGMESFWATETSEWRRRGLPNPENVQFKDIGGWNAISYRTSAAGESNSHLRAHYLMAGTWIDVHLSITSKTSEKNDSEYLEEYLRSISVVRRE